MNAPCYKCPKRHQACHDSCPDYKEWSDKRKKLAEKKLMSESDYVHMRNVIKTKRRYNIK